MDKFQKRYLEHQKRKKEEIEKDSEYCKVHYSFDDQATFVRILENRRSQRVFNNNSIDAEEIECLEYAKHLSPSSCNRKAIYFKKANPKEIEKYLVGASNWGNKANKVLLLFGDKKAYKSPNEKSFMPYLDAGFVAQNMYLMCEILSIGACFVNPNIRLENKPGFDKKFNKKQDYFCGAMFIGHYNKKIKY